VGRGSEGEGLPEWVVPAKLDVLARIQIRILRIRTLLLGCVGTLDVGRLACRICVGSGSEREGILRGGVHTYTYPTLSKFAYAAL